MSDNIDISLCVRSSARAASTLLEYPTPRTPQTLGARKIRHLAPPWTSARAAIIAQGVVKRKSRVSASGCTGQQSRRSHTYYRIIPVDSKVSSQLWLDYICHDRSYPWPPIRCLPRCIIPSHNHLHPTPAKPPIATASFGSDRKCSLARPWHW